MKTVGLRELKNRLSVYVGHVRRGEVVAVTDRGAVVAELVPPQLRQAAASGVAQLAAKGELTAAEPASRRHRASLYPEMPRALRRHTAARLLDAERGER